MDIDLKVLLAEAALQRDQAIADRRYLHRHPEISDREFATSAWLKERCREQGLQVHELTGTGFIAELLGTGTGSDIAIGLRTDIDALPITESEVNAGDQVRTCLSENIGVMHACGHDAHMAIQLAVMRLFAQHQHSFAGKIVFIFEQGEETHSGIAEMIEYLKGHKLSAIYGTHVYTGLDIGQVALTPGPIMSGMTTLQLAIEGKGGHSSRPDLARSPIFGAANFLQAVANGWLNCSHPDRPVTLGLGSIAGGSPQAYNVIPDSVTISGTLRFFHSEAGAEALARFDHVGESSCLYNDLRYRPLTGHGETMAPVINNPEMTEKFIKLAETLPGLSILTDYRWYASETFARYSELCPCLFTLNGCRNQQRGIFAEHHTSTFDIDEAVLGQAIDLATSWIWQQMVLS